jgi:hypothetical protein
MYGESNSLGLGSVTVSKGIISNFSWEKLRGILVKVDSNMIKETYFKKQKHSLLKIYLQINKSKISLGHRVSEF